MTQEELNKIYQNRQDWFHDRIGKLVYRNKASCSCKICVQVGEDGLVIFDEQHAYYLHDIESCFTAEGHPTRYFDTMEEVKEFVAGLEDNCKEE